MSAETCSKRRTVLQDIKNLIEQMIKINELASEEEDNLIQSQLDDTAIEDVIQLTLDAGTGLSTEIIEMITAETWTYAKRQA